MNPESLSPAQVYDQRFVPALFQYWGNIVADIAQIDSGQRVLDVACGTGVLACAAAQRTGHTGAVTGLDANEEMLSVARQKTNQIRWTHGLAESLPFEANEFDVVASQFGFMFFEDRVEALREMMRVLRPGGRLTVVVCDGLDHSPGYAVLAELLHRLFGESVAAAFRAPFVCGDHIMLQSLCKKAGIENAEISRHDGPVRFDTIDDLVATERACAWTLGGLLTDSQFDRLRTEAQESLIPFLDAGGKVQFTMPALAISATK